VRSNKSKSREIAIRRNNSAADKIPFRLRPMLATLTDEPFDWPGWRYEEKYDGDRIIAYKQDGQVRLLSRNGKDRTKQFEAVTAAIGRLRPSSLLLDGEVVVFDRGNVSHFQLLQRGEGAPVYMVFDCLWCDGRDLRTQPLIERLAVLAGVLKEGQAIRRAKALATNGLRAFQQAKRRGLEGLVAKDLSSAYVEARSTLWRKVKVHREDEFIILGYTRPGGARRYFGALLLGAHDRGKLRYVGKVGTGFDAATLTSLYRQLVPLKTASLPLAVAIPERNVTLVRPHLVAQISYQELTGDGKLRQPVFLGLRSDKPASDVVLPK